MLQLRGGRRLLTTQEAAMKLVLVLGLVLLVSACGDSVPLVPFI
ncbi:hypothetical protein [Rhodobacter maris]|nr:hypothetical protein [Rhodobacter maris]